MSLFSFSDHCLECFGSKYFVRNAPLMTEGSYGKKSDPIYAGGKLEPKDHLPAPKIDGKVQVKGPFTLDTSRTSRADFDAAVGASIKVVGVSVSGGTGYDALASGKLVALQLWIEENDIRDAINASPKALDNLGSYGGDARVVHSVFVVGEAVWATSFSRSTSIGVSVNAAGIVQLDGKGGSGSGGTSTLVLAPETVIAYGMVKLDWNPDKSRVTGTSVDEKGIQ